FLLIDVQCCGATERQDRSRHPVKLSVEVAVVGTGSGVPRVAVSAFGRVEHGTFDLPDLVPLELTPFPRAQPGVAQRSDPGPDQAHDGMSDRLEHATDLTVATLVDRDSHDAGVDERHLRGSGRTVVEVDAFPQTAYRSSRWATLHLGDVLLVHPEARMGHP